MAKVIVEWPAWYHSPDGHSAVFMSFGEVPAGWTRKKPPPFVPVEPVQTDPEAIRQKLLDLNINVDPHWGTAQMLKVLNDRSPPR